MQGSKTSQQTLTDKQTEHTCTQNKKTCVIVHVRTGKRDIHVHYTELRRMCKLHQIHYSIIVGTRIFCVHNISSNGVLPALFQSWSLMKDIVLENQHWSCKRLENGQHLIIGDIYSDNVRLSPITQCTKGYKAWS